MKTMEHRQTVSAEQLQQVVERVQKCEAAGEVDPWEVGDIPESLIPADRMPEGAKPTSVRRWESLDLHQLVFPNGMKVAYKCTDFLDDQVLVSGFAYGGLSEVARKDFNSASCAMLLVNEV